MQQTTSSRFQTSSGFIEQVDKVLPYVDVQAISADRLAKTQIWKLTRLIDEVDSSHGIGAMGMPVRSSTILPSVACGFISSSEFLTIMPVMMPGRHRLRRPDRRAPAAAGRHHLGVRRRRRRRLNGRPDRQAGLQLHCYRLCGRPGEVVRPQVIRRCFRSGA